MKDFEKFKKSVNQHLLMEEFIDKDEFKLYIRRYIDYGLMKDVVDNGIYENNTIIDLINENDWDKDPVSFHESIKKSKRFGYLSYYNIDELSKMNLFKVTGFDIGFALNDDLEIIGVHNNTNIKNIGTFLMLSAIKNGGIKLDHFDGYLTGFYYRIGFIEDKEKREKWNNDLTPIKWEYEKIDVLDPDYSVYAEEINKDNIYLYKDVIERYKSGKPDIIFRKLKK